MSPVILIGDTGLLDTGEIVVAGYIRSAPILRLLQKAEPERVLHLTYGYPRRSLVLLRNGYLVVLPLTIAELSAQMREDTPDDDD